MGLPVLSLPVALDKYPDAKIFVCLRQDNKFDFFGGLQEENSDDIIRKIVNYEIVTKQFACVELLYNLAFLLDTLSFCCYDVGKNQSPSVPYIPSRDSFPIQFGLILEKRMEILDSLNSGGVSECTGCTSVRELFVPENYKAIYLLNLINWSGPNTILCNCKCIYCNHAERTEVYEFPHKEILDYLRLNGAIDPITIYMLYAMGEITVQPHREKVFEAFQDFNVCYCTNAFLFSEPIYDMLKKGKGALDLSLDCGTRETFEKVKGIDLFDKVLDNLRKYNQNRKGQLYLKYIFIPGVNDNFADIEGFVNICAELNVTEVRLAHNLRQGREEFYNRSMVNCFAKMKDLLNISSLRYTIASNILLNDMPKDELSKLSALKKISWLRRKYWLKYLGYKTLCAFTFGKFRVKLDGKKTKYETRLRFLSR